MPCNCTGLKTKQCNCKFIGYPLKQSRPVPFPTQFILERFEDGSQFSSCCSAQSPTSNKWFRLIEDIYDKCAAYNIRYCPLRRSTYNDKHVTAAAKDFFILVCFLIANLVVFLNLTAMILAHLFVLFKEIGCGVKKFLCSSKTSDSMNLRQEGASNRYSIN